MLLMNCTILLKFWWAIRTVGEAVLRISVTLWLSKTLRQRIFCNNIATSSQHKSQEEDSMIHFLAWRQSRVYFASPKNCQLELFETAVWRSIMQRSMQSVLLETFMGLITWRIFNSRAGISAWLLTDWKEEQNLSNKRS